MLKSNKSKKSSFRTKAIPMTFGRQIHLERLADDAHIRALDRKAKKKPNAKKVAKPFLPFKPKFQWAVVRELEGGVYLCDDGEFLCLYDTPESAKAHIKWMKSHYTKKELRSLGRIRVAKLETREIEEETPANPVSEEVAALRKLVSHCWVHSGYPDCGYAQMTTEQRRMYCQIVGRCLYCEGDGCRECRKGLTEVSPDE